MLFFHVSEGKLKNSMDIQLARWFSETEFFEIPLLQEINES